MKTKRIKVKFLLIALTVVLIFTNAMTYVMLLSKNEEWKALSAEKNTHGYNTYDVLEALNDHVYYDGDTIPCNQIVRHYGRSGIMMKNDKLGNVLQGNKVVLLLSTNCCSSCAVTEIDKLLKVTKKIGRENLIVIADYAIHKHSSISMCFDKEGYFESDIEHLGLKGTPTRETPVVLLTQNGQIRTSFLVGPQTIDFADMFHDYLIEYFKGKK